jgi:NAD-dependent SIR2 family protein deacetylase
MRVPSELIPHCPKCGAPMTMNLRSDEKFVEDDGWKAAAKRYDDFVLNHKNGKMVLLELGVGFNTPDIIKYPFWKLAYRNPDVTYLCVNSEDAEVPDEIERQSLLFQEDIGTFLKEMDIR